MKITTVDGAIKAFRDGRDLWSRNHIELFVREIEHIRKLNDFKTDALYSYSNFYDALLAAIGKPKGTPHSTETDSIILQALAESTGKR